MSSSNRDSLWQLARQAYAYTARVLSVYGQERSLYDAFHMNFVTQLQAQHMTRNGNRRRRRSGSQRQN